MKLVVNGYFYPIGQGTFATGHLRTPRGTFCWVYDCGTSSKKSLLSDAWRVEKLRHRSKRPKFDLAVISHFDKDHVSGFVELLRDSTVEVLLLPYVPLAKRMLIILEQKIAIRTAAYKFISDPAAYMAEVSPWTRVVFVQPGGSENPPESGNPDDAVPRDFGPDDEDPNDEDPPEDVNDKDRKPLSPTIPTVDPSSLRNELKDEVDIWLKAQCNVSVLTLGAAITIEKIWEFVPYNDMPQNFSLTSLFSKAVASLRDQLVLNPTKHALTALKDEYIRLFGKGSIQRNKISLFLYAGTLRNAKIYGKPCNRYAQVELLEPFSAITPPSWRRHAAILYTGDGFLATPLQLVSYINAIGMRRLAGISLLQVMHHGSRKNCHPMVSTVIKPWISVFCANPLDGRYGHPHTEVEGYFGAFNPVTADTMTGVKFQITTRI